MIRLHSEGWSITSIAQYLQTSRPTIYATLSRWTEEGVAGLEEKSRARKGPRKATLQVRNEIRKLQQNPLLGEYRVHTALKRLGATPWQTFWRVTLPNLKLSLIAAGLLAGSIPARRASKVDPMAALRCD